MRRILAVGVLLVMVQASALAGNVTTFEGGYPDAVADLKSPECRNIINITLPALCHIRKATMNVSSLFPQGSSSDFPEHAQIFLNDTLLWEFNESGYGALGMQNMFINGAADWKSGFGQNGGLNGTKIRLPKGAIVQHATVDMNFSGHGGLEHYMNLSGAAAYDGFSYSMSCAGDVNNDGYDDIIVGAPMNDAGGTDAGRAYIYCGGPDMDSTPDVILTGASATDLFGESVSGAGDVNKDGYDDVIVGACDNDAGGEWAGRAYIYFGGANMDSTADLILTGAGPNDYFGGPVSGAGDVNNDGYDDVIVGSCNNTGGTNAGRAYIYYGGASMDNIPDVIMTGASADDYFGGPASGAGDVNNDGIDDVIVGAIGNDTGGTDAGQVYIYYGGASINSTPDVILTGVAAYDYFGASVSVAGDVNNDGYDDVVVGAYNNDAAGINAGQAYIYYGGPSMDSTADVIMTGAAMDDYFGHSVSGAGDVNKDGFDDVVIGAYGSDTGGTDAGQAYIYYGGANMDNTADVIMTGASPADLFGFTVSAIGDIDNDGYGDLIVGAPNGNTSGSNPGLACIYKSFDGIKGGSVSTGPISIWKDPWYVNGTNLSRDFGAELDQYVRNNHSSGTDKYGNSYVDVPIQVSGKSAGNIALANLKIVYLLDAAIPDFTDILNQYITIHKDEKDVHGDITVPLTVVSGTPGRLKLKDLSIIVDESPKLIKPIPKVQLPEDSVNPQLVDLYEYFQDDYDLKDQMQFTIASTTNESFVKVEVLGNQFISADALEGDANDNWTGDVEVVVMAADQWNSTTFSNPFRIEVMNVNDAPSITSQPPINGTGGQEYLYQVRAVDGDNDTLTYELMKNPEGMTINASSGLIHWIPSKWGNYDVTVTVSDGSLTAYQEFEITVANRPPRITNTTVPTAFVDMPYSYIIQAVDDDGDGLNFSLVRGLDQLKLDPSTGNITWAPAQLGDFTVSVSISDGMDETIYNFTIMVVQGDHVPKFSSDPVKYAYAGLPYVYEAKATDMDGDTLTFRLVTMPDRMAIDSATGKITWTPIATGNYTVKLAVMDGKGGEGAQEFVIKVTELVRSKVEFTTPAEGKTLKGKLTVTGKAVKGTLEIVSIQLHVDSGDWMNVTGNSTWQYTLDTTKLENGKHTLQARAYDGMDYSDAVDRAIIVDNQKPSGKGFIPMMDGWMALALLGLVAVVSVLRRK